MSLEIQQKSLKFSNMRFLKIINHKKFILTSILFSVYLIFNLLDGERGLISYYDNQTIKNNLLKEKNSLTTKLNIIENEVQMLSENINVDYLEILYREKFMVGKENEKIYIK